MTHLTSALEQDEKMGFELYTFEVATSFIMASVEKGNRIGDPDYIKEAICSMYLTTSRPRREEVSQVKMKPGENDGCTRVTLILKRGHWEIAAFIKKNGDGKNAFDLYYHKGKLIIEGNGEILELSPESLP